MEVVESDGGKKGMSVFLDKIAGWFFKGSVAAAPSDGDVWAWDATEGVFEIRTPSTVSYGGAGYPLDVEATESDGVATSVARSDHQHKMGILTTLGDILYRGASAAAQLAGNTTATKQFLTQTGTGSASAAPAWGPIVVGDLPGHGPAQHTTGTAWRVVYQDVNGDEQELALGAAGTVLQSNGASSAPSWASASSGLSRAGGNTTEATTTSTSVVDLMSITVTAISAATPFTYLYNGRKTSGAADRVQVGLKLNTTVVTDPVMTTVTNTGYNGSTTNQAEDGMAVGFIPARVTNYLRGGIQLVINKASSGVAGPLANAVASASVDAALPTADITTVVLLGRSADALNTLGVDEAHVYTYATS